LVIALLFQAELSFIARLFRARASRLYKQEGREVFSTNRIFGRLFLG
jgi:hypothetical protein